MIPLAHSLNIGYCGSKFREPGNSRPLEATQEIILTLYLESTGRMQDQLGRGLFLACSVTVNTGDDGALKASIRLSQHLFDLAGSKLGPLLIFVHCGWTSGELYLKAKKIIFPST